MTQIAKFLKPFSERRLRVVTTEPISMKKLVVSVGIIALGSSVMQAVETGALNAQQTKKAWSVSASLRGFYDDNFNSQSSATKKSSPKQKTPLKSPMKQRPKPLTTNTYTKKRKKTATIMPPRQPKVSSSHSSAQTHAEHQLKPTSADSSPSSMWKFQAISHAKPHSMRSAHI